MSISYLYIQGHNLIDENRARTIARDIFYKYDRDRTNILDLGKASTMLNDGTKHLQGAPQQTKQDIALFMKFLDHNKDGRVTIQDFEVAAIKALCSSTPVKKIYTSTVRKRLQVAKRLFKQFDVDGSNTLTEAQIPAIIRETYKQMGISYQPTREDVKTWMSMTDQNNDGIIQYNEFENMIIRSLQNMGIKIYE